MRICDRIKLEKKTLYQSIYTVHNNSMGIFSKMLSLTHVVRPSFPKKLNIRTYKNTGNFSNYIRTCKNKGHSTAFVLERTLEIRKIFALELYEC